MKTAMLFVLLSVIVSAAFAIPQLINYQGQLADTSGTPFDTTVSMTFAVYNSASSGTVLWTESEVAVAVNASLYNVLLGTVNPIPDSIVSSDELWLGVTIGDDSEQSPRQMISAVAYAFRVSSIDGSSGGTISGKLNVGQSNTNDGEFSNVFGRHNNASGDYSVVAGGGAWASLCDVNQKNIYGTVDSHALLDKVLSLPLYRWSYKAQDARIQHIGPTAQDFYAAFGLGQSDTTICTLDPDGIALAAIQELAKENQEQDIEIRELQAQVQSLLADKQQSARIEQEGE